MVQVHARRIELVPEVRAPRACAALVIGSVHDVVGQELGAAVEELRERLRAVLGLEDVLLRDRNPGKRTAFLRGLAAEPGVLGLELRELIAGCLPLLLCADRVLRHHPTSSWESLKGRRKPALVIIDGQPTWPEE